MWRFKAALMFVVGLSLGLLATALHRGAAVNATPSEQAGEETLPVVQLDRVDYDGTPLSQVLADLAARGKLNLAVDQNAMKSAGMNMAAPVYLHLKNVTLAATLDWVLDQNSPQARLEYQLDHHILTVSTADQMDMTVVLRSYDVHDLMEDEAAWLSLTSEEEDQARSNNPYFTSSSVSINAGDNLKKLIEDTVTPDLWRDTGGSIGSIYVWTNKRLVVQSNSTSQKKVAVLLEQMRHPMATPFSAPATQILYPELTAAIVLQKPLADVDLEHTTLREAFARLGKLCDLSIVPEWKTFSQDANLPLDIHLRHISLGQALIVVTACTGRLGPMSIRLEGDKLRVLFPDEDDVVETRVYDVHELLSKHIALTPPKIEAMSDTTAPVTPRDAIDTLCVTIEDSIAPETWHTGGSVGSIKIFARNLVVTATPPTQAKVAELLKKLGEADNVK